MNDHLSHLGLARWPFTVVPSPDSCDYLADRAHLRADIVRLIRGFRRHESSSIHVFWAWFGDGKTHTLYYIRNEVKTPRDKLEDGVTAVYTEFPRAPRGFLDVYRAFACALDIQGLTDAYLEIATGALGSDVNRQIRAASVDLHKAFRVLVTGTADTRDVAERWLKAEALPVAEVRRAGLSRPLKSPEDAVRVFPQLVRVLTLAKKQQGAQVGKLVWLIDEFQRISEAGTKALRSRSPCCWRCRATWRSRGGCAEVRASGAEVLESSAWTTFSVTPSSSSSRGTSARMEEGVATAGSPALLLAHSRVIGMLWNP